MGLINERDADKMKALPFVSIIVVNYNGKKYLSDCFTSLLALNYPKNKFEIIMVDNGSTDKSLDYVKRKFPGIKIIKNDINNYAKANNLGIEAARGKYVALINNDVKADKNWLIELVKALNSDKSIGAAGGKILFMDGKIESTGHQELPNFYWSDRGCKEKDRGQYNRKEEVASLSGCAILYRKDAFKDVGFFDEDFNMYMEDVDVNVRLKQKNWKIVYTPKSLVKHIHHGTAQEDISLFYTERNRLFFIAKHYPEKLGDALLGRGYFTAKRDIKAESEIYNILVDVVLKLIKHHNRGIVKNILTELFDKLKKISNYENVFLKDKIEELINSLESNKQIIDKKEEYISSLNLELAKRDEALKSKDSYITSLTSELAKRDEALKSKDSYITSLDLELARRNEVLKEKNECINRLNLEISNKTKELQDIYDSTAFKFIVRPLWAVLWRIKEFIKNALILEASSKKKSIDLQDKKHVEKVDVGKIGICTIISKNYLAYARVLAESFLQYNGGEVFVLLVDKIDNYFDPKKERFTVIEIDAIKDRIPHFDKFCFQYNITELNTAVKPFFLEFLFEKFQLQKLIFFDPDILITSELNDLFSLLDKFSIILIPHITQPFKDTHKPSELEILRAGVYNLGFIALSYTNSTRNLIGWWKKRLKRYCTVDIENGLFVDQKWIDLIPGFFDDVFILRDPSYNIAYWNLHYRKAYIEKDNILIDGKPVHFLHFSGFNPEDPDSISKHQDRFRPNDLNEMKQVFELYKNKLIANSYNLSKKWPCVFNHFDNGVVIPDIARRTYWAMSAGTKIKFGNPFNAIHKNNYFNWLSEPIDNKNPKVTRFMYELYKNRLDVQRVYLDIFGTHREGFIRWFLESAKAEYNLDSSFLESIGPSSNVKYKGRVSIKIKDIAYHRIRALLKTILKKIFKNNLWMINNLRMTEFHWNRKIADINNLIKKKNRAPLNKYEDKNGVNVVGYLTSELGVGEGARANIKCLKSAGIDFSIINIDDHSSSRKNDFSFSGFSKHNPFGINLIHINADMFPRIYLEKGNKFFKDKYNIGFWTWELPDFPDYWLDSFKYCDEIWVPSNFTLASIAKKSPIPVIRIPHAVKADNIKNVDRSFFELRDDEFVFLFIFDFFSYFERKNSLADIQAFKKSFSPSEKVKLVIKCCNSSFDPAAMKVLRQAAAGLNINIMDKYLYRDEVNALLSLCDCYVSLHRSEGFGLTMAEAMYLGKPVIATGYSGNADFMNANNSFLVKYKLVEIEKDVGPYRKGCVWAQPDIEHASELMRCVYTNRDAAKEVGRKAARDIKINLNYNVIGEEIRNRIEHIYNSTA